MNTLDKLQKNVGELSAQFRQLPTRSQKIVVASLLGALLVMAVAFALWRSHVHHTPEYALRIIDRIESRSDLESRRDYMTAQGLKVISYLLESRKGPSTGPAVQFQECQIRGVTCYFPFEQGTTAGYMQFEQGEVWQFHDIVVTRHEGRDVDLSIAYAIDHPILVVVKNAPWGEFFQSFIQGFMIGLASGS